MTTYAPTCTDNQTRVLVVQLLPSIVAVASIDVERGITELPAGLGVVEMKQTLLMLLDPIPERDYLDSCVIALGIPCLSSQIPKRPSSCHAMP